MSRHALGLFAALGIVAASGASAADLPVKAPAAAVQPPLFIVNDNSISYSYQFTATNPGTGYTPKHVLTYTHFDIWNYGTNFINVDYLKATNGAQAPAAPCGFPSANVNCEGFTEIFAIIRNTIGWNQLTGSKMFSAGPLTNISFLVGGDLNTDNTNLGSAKRSIEAGLQFDFAAPYKGFFNVGLVAYKEWQHDGIAAQLGSNPSGHVDFDTTWGVEVNYVQPLGFLPSYLPLTYKALVTIRGPKGAGEAGAAQRTTEYFTQQLLSLDIGQVVAAKPNIVSVWGGYRWWKNKFGLDPVPSGVCCTLESTWITGATWVF